MPLYGQRLRALDDLREMREGAGMAAGMTAMEPGAVSVRPPGYMQGVRDRGLADARNQTVLHYGIRRQMEQDAFDRQAYEDERVRRIAADALANRDRAFSRRMQLEQMGMQRQAFRAGRRDVADERALRFAEVDAENRRTEALGLKAAGDRQFEAGEAAKERALRVALANQNAALKGRLTGGGAGPTLGARSSKANAVKVDDAYWDPVLESMGYDASALYDEAGEYSPQGRRFFAQLNALRQQYPEADEQALVANAAERAGGLPDAADKSLKAYRDSDAGFWRVRKDPKLREQYEQQMEQALARQDAADAGRYALREEQMARPDVPMVSLEEIEGYGLRGPGRGRRARALAVGVEEEGNIPRRRGGATPFKGGFKTGEGAGPTQSGPTQGVNPLVGVVREDLRGQVTESDLRMINWALKVQGKGGEDTSAAARKVLSQWGVDPRAAARKLARAAEARTSPAIEDSGTPFPAKRGTKREGGPMTGEGAGPTPDARGGRKTRRGRRGSGRGQALPPVQWAEAGETRGGTGPTQAGGAQAGSTAGEYRMEPRQRIQAENVVVRAGVEPADLQKLSDRDLKRLATAVENPDDPDSQYVLMKFGFKPEGLNPIKLALGPFNPLPDTVGRFVNEVNTANRMKALYAQRKRQHR